MREIIKVVKEKLVAKYLKDSSHLKTIQKKLRNLTQE